MRADDLTHHFRRYRTPKGQSRIDNPEKPATLATLATGQEKNKTQQHNTTQKAKMMSNTNPINLGGERNTNPINLGSERNTNPTNLGFERNTNPINLGSEPWFSPMINSSCFL